MISRSEFILLTIVTVVLTSILFSYLSTVSKLLDKKVILINSENIVIASNFQHVNISLLIPVPSSRLDDIQPLLNSVSNGSKLPREIVISVSETNEIPEFFNSDQIPSNLHLTIILSPGKKNAAENRNIAASHATMPILSVIDSDDIIHESYMDTVDVFFKAHEGGDALLHPYFACSKGVPEDIGNGKIVKVNDISPKDATDEELFLWVKILKFSFK